jgi:ectoine hydroxylase-related dioxygenase (phytanoyl-CoA dioxygenase family)
MSVDDRGAGDVGRSLAPEAQARLAAYAETFARDGVVHIPQALNAADLAMAKKMFDWSYAHPGQAAQHMHLNGDEFFVDTNNTTSREIYREMMAESTLPAIAAAATGLDRLWYLGEQIFQKQGTRDTAASGWHQDTAYLNMSPAGGVAMWITFDRLDPEYDLQFVRGSHRGPLYNPSHVPEGEYEPVWLYPESSGMPPFPDIEANPGNFDIVSWPFEPGDVILFHMSTMHGRAPVPPSGLRRTLCLRFVGPEVRYEFRAGRETTGNLSVEATEFIWKDMKENMPVHEGKYFYKVFENTAA